MGGHQPPRANHELSAKAGGCGGRARDAQLTSRLLLQRTRASDQTLPAVVTVRSTPSGPTEALYFGGPRRIRASRVNEQEHYPMPTNAA